MQDDTKIIFKSHDNNEEFFVYGNPELMLKWRKDKTIPLIDVIQSFDIYETVNGGNVGIAGRPSKQRLENAFGTSDYTKAITHILEHGVAHTHKGRSSKDHRTIINETRGKGVYATQNVSGIHN